MTASTVSRGGRRTETLGDLADYVNGRAFGPDDWGPVGLPIIRIENLNDPAAPANHFDGDLDLKHRAGDGDLLVSWSATLDVFWWNRGPAAVNQHIFKVVENPNKVRREFLYFLLKSVMEQLREQVHGSTMKHITKPKFTGLKVCIPADLEEQREIAAELRERTARAAVLEVALAKQSDAAQALIGALIDQAVGGDLEVLGTLGEVLNRPAKSGWSPKCDDLSGGTPVLTLSSVTGFVFRPEAVKLTSAAVEEHAGYWASNGALYMARSNTASLVGHVAIANGLDRPTIYPDLLMLLDVDRSRVDVEFAHLWLMSRTARTHIQAQARGSSGTMKKVNQSIINAIPFPTTLSREAQGEIVSRLRDRTDAARRVQAAVTRALDAAEALPGAIVREAFEIENLDTVEDD